MAPGARHRPDRNGLELLEEAVQVLRRLPAAALAPYCYGTLPFVLGLLYFWTDMSRGAFAHEHAGEAALGLGALYVWMKAWQAEFARRVRALVAAEPLPRWDWRRWARGLLTQGALQPLGLLVIPLTLTVVVPGLLQPGLVLLLPLVLFLALPFAWVFAFFQNVTVLDDGCAVRLRALLARAWGECVRAPRQNIEGLLLLELLALIVALNWALAGYLAPGLAKDFLGLESVFTRSPGSLANSTSLALVAALTYVSVDPVAKTFYLLRCFYAAARTTGEDLHAELKRLAAPAVAVLALGFLGLATAPELAAAAAGPAPEPSVENASAAAPETAAPETTPPPAPEPFAPAVAPAELDGALDEVLAQRKYTWRSPREEVAGEGEPGPVLGFMEEAALTIRRALRRFSDWLDEKLTRPRRQASPPDADAQGVDWMGGARNMLLVVLAVVAAVLGVMLFRWWRAGRRRGPAPAMPVAPLPDLADENVSADQLPEDGWARLARELLARGEFRLALRALYLSSLAHLAARDLIRLARFKSNRDYERELRRRGHARPEVPALFSENVTLFDSVWYGRRPVSESLLGQFAANVDKLKGAA